MSGSLDVPLSRHRVFDIGRATGVLRLGVVLAAGLCAACTGGQVRKDGDPVAGADVSIWTCEAIGDFQTETDGGGNYAFNPFRQDSPTLDDSKFVPPGPIAINVTGDEGSSVTRRNHQYDDTCQIRYNGSVQDLPCKIQNINLEPMQFNEFLAEQAEFLEEDCGLAARDATRLVTASIGGRRVGEIGGLTTRPSTESCLTECSESCIYQDVPVGEMVDCMCICVEGNCGASFGPFCTESDAASDPAPRPQNR